MKLLEGLQEILNLRKMTMKDLVLKSGLTEAKIKEVMSQEDTSPDAPYFVIIADAIKIPAHALLIYCIGEEDVKEGKLDSFNKLHSPLKSIVKGVIEMINSLEESEEEE